MSKAKMETAKELIQEKRYAEARTILKTINHPMAAEWIAKIDAIPGPAKQSGKGGALVIVFVALVGVIALAVVAWVKVNNDIQRDLAPIIAASDSAMGQLALASGCRRANNWAFDICKYYSQTAYGIYKDAVQICGKQYDYIQFSTLFTKCLVEHDVIFYPVYEAPTATR